MKNDSREWILIEYGVDKWLSTHVHSSQLWCKNAKVDYYLDKQLLNAIEFLIKFYPNSKPIITSNYRTKAYELSLTGKTVGSHRPKDGYCIALDVKFVDIDTNKVNLENHYAECADYKHDNLTRSALIANGIRGLGLYNNRLHIDSRNTDLYNFGLEDGFAFWDMRTYDTVKIDGMYRKKKINDMTKFLKIDEDAEYLSVSKILIFVVSFLFLRKPLYKLYKRYF